MKRNYDIDSPSSLAYIDMLQGIIARMASNSSNCKSLAVTLVAAILALSSTSTDKIFFLTIGILILMYLLDCFYLGLERHFKEKQNIFVNACYKSDKDDEPEEEAPKPFVMESTEWCDKLVFMVQGTVSFSTTPFYLALSVIIYYFFKM